MNKPIDDLVFDIGAHLGEDSAYYLRRGFRVLSVECEPTHVRFLKKRFERELLEGRLTLIDRAIAPQSGPIIFYRNKNLSVWGTAEQSWADRNISLGAEVEEIFVHAITAPELFQTYGIPYYLKIDIEGSDMLVVRALEDFATKPAYLSLESEAVSFDRLRDEFAALGSLGYSQFKLSPQHLVQQMKIAPSSMHGTFLDYVFEEHSSGPFGEDLEGRWLTAGEALAEYKAVFVLYDLDDALRSGVLQGRLADFQAKYGHQAGWYDTHARHRDFSP